MSALPVRTFYLYNKKRNTPTSSEPNVEVGLFGTLEVQDLFSSARCVTPFTSRRGVGERGAKNPSFLRGPCHRCSCRPFRRRPRSCLHGHQQRTTKPYLSIRARAHRCACDAAASLQRRRDVQEVLGGARSGPFDRIIPQEKPCLNRTLVLLHISLRVQQCTF